MSLEAHIYEEIGELDEYDLVKIHKSIHEILKKKVKTNEISIEDLVDEVEG